MNASRADCCGLHAAIRLIVMPQRLALPLATALVLSSASLSPAAAQEAPISLFPPTVAEPEAAPETEQTPSQPESTPPDSSRPDSSLGDTPQYEGIQVDQLEALDSESLGILEPDFGGLGRDAWAGSDRGFVQALIAALPGDPASPTLRALTTRLLLSNAQAPERRDKAAGPATLADAVAGSQDSTFLRLRAERLYAMGELAGLSRLLDIVPQRLDDSWLAQARVDGLLLQARDEEACTQVRTVVARFPAEPYWARALVFCLFSAEQRDQAFLALDLLREQDPDGDPAFYGASNLFIGGEPDGLTADTATPLTLAMLRVGKAAPPAGLAESGAPLLLHGLAAMDQASALDRAMAMERLVQAAILPGAALAEAYNAIPFDAAELADPLARAEQAGGLRGRALLFHAADSENIASAKAEFLIAALTAAEAAGRGHAMTRAVQPLLETLAPVLELAWFAPAATRSFYRVGQFERAGAWAGVLRVDGLKNPDSQAAYEALQPYARLVGGGEPLAAREIAAPEIAAPEVGGGEAGEGGASENRLLLAMILSRSLGQDEPAAWPGMLDGSAGAGLPPLENLSQLLALGDAAAAGRRGESVLLAALVLGDGPAGDAHPLALGYAVSALNTLGLGREARALALESAFDAGL
ncbi:hypothetical protein [Pelagibius sp.]|uniref:hypothetical protein n=1 Tax=Pelagibius sp. TaxID=1931238 RepID=UPI003BB07032